VASPVTRVVRVSRFHQNEVNEVVDVVPEQCMICGAVLGEEVPGEDAFAHHVTELPPAKARVTEYRLWRKKCPHCGGRTRAKRPKDVPADAFGPRLNATIATLCAKYRISRREVAELASDLFSVDVSVGTVQAVCERVSESVVPAVQEIRKEVATAPAVHADETGWRQKGAMHWLWVATTPDAAYFVLAEDRGHSALSKLLPEDFEGIVHCDRWRPYQRFGDARQLCHAHLRRDFQAAIDRGGKAKPVGKRLLAASDRLFDVWHAFLQDEIDRKGMILDMEPVQAEWESAVIAAFESPDAKLIALAKDLWNQWDVLWTFVHQEGVEPTNNDAERALRPAVLWRKGSFGTQSDAGSLFVARMRTVIDTAKRRGVHFIDWLEQACHADIMNRSPPPLLLA